MFVCNVNLQVWPGTIVFPDFTNPKTVEWWYNQAKQFHDILPFDGLWTVRYYVTTLCLTRCSAIAERPHCRVRYSVRQK